MYTPPLADGDYTIVSVPRAATAGCNAYFGASTCATPAQVCSQYKSSERDKGKTRLQCPLWGLHLCQPCSGMS